MDGALAGEQVHRQQVDGGASPGLSPEGQGGGDGLHRLLGGHPRPEEVLQQLGRLGALLFGPRTGAHAVAQEEEELPILPAEPQAGVTVTFSPCRGPRPGWPGPGRGSAWAKAQPVPCRLPLPEVGSQDLGEFLAGCQVFSSSEAGTSTRR